MLDAEADQLRIARKYARSATRVNSRAGHYKGKLHTTSGEVEFKVPKLREAKFKTAIIEWHRRREPFAEEALMEMYLASVSVRRVENITQALWSTRVSAGTVSDLNQKVYKRLDKWRNRKIKGRYLYVYLDGISLKRTWGGEVRNVSALVAISVANDGHCDILGIAESCK